MRGAPHSISIVLNAFSHRILCGVALPPTPPPPVYCVICSSSISNNGAGGSGVQSFGTVIPDSVVRGILNVDELQTDIIIKLLEATAIHQDGDAAGGGAGLLKMATAGGSGGSVAGSVPRLVLNHLRWVNYLVDWKTVSDKVLELLDGIICNSASMPLHSGVLLLLLLLLRYSSLATPMFRANNPL